LKLLRPVPRAVARPASLLIVVAWVFAMAAVARAAWRQAGTPLATDIARYSQSAQWKGVYYRGEKIGFMVGESSPAGDGFELREEGQLRLLLMGSSAVARIQTSARVDREFNLLSFRFALDPGSGPIRVEGRVEGLRLLLAISGPTGTREETRELKEPPALSLNLSRRLAARGLTTGTRLTVTAFDPATLSNSPMEIEVQAREVVWSAGRPVPAFRVETRFAGITSRSWITDVGEIVREESPMGLIVVRETPERATALAVPGSVQQDLLQSAAVAASGRRIDDPAQLVRLRVRLEGAPLSGDDVQGAGQTVTGDVIEVRRADDLPPQTADADLERHLRPEPLIESDAPEIVDEARRAVGDARATRAQAEALVRHVHALIDKKPTVSLPSAREVLRTRVGDCNEHTALYVALARAIGLPARVAVGLVHVHGAFYYHAWPEVFLSSGAGRGVWTPVDPTLGQFPADPSHLRLARGGLERQTAILPLLGRAKLRVLELETRADAPRVMVGETRPDAPTFVIPRRAGGRGSCWSAPAP
jgi:transglutaminase-like putative cysteine protease